MRRLYADKLVLISAALILLFSALFAFLQSTARRGGAGDATLAPDAASNPLAAQGGELFGSRCASCHALAAAQKPLRDGGDEAAARDRLLRFLEGHGHSSATENPAIVEFLAHTARAPAQSDPPAP